MRRKRVASRGMEVRCRRVDSGGIEIGSSGDALQALPQKRYGSAARRRVPRVATWRRHKRFGALEMRCSRRDIEVWSSSVLLVVVGISSFRSSRLASEWFERGCRVEKFAEGVNCGHC